VVLCHDQSLAGAAWKEYGLNLTMAMNLEGAAAGGCQLVFALQLTGTR
jgi:hypothetical protein